MAMRIRWVFVGVLLFVSVLLSSTAWAAQQIQISNENTGRTVSGNGDPLDNGGSVDMSKLVDPNGNTITITDSILNLVRSGLAANRFDNTATGNSVVMSGASKATQVTGGDTNGNSGPVIATNNSVTIGSTVTVSGTDLLGGAVFDGGGNHVAGMDAFTGNTLNIREHTGSIAVNTVANFQNFNFLLPSSVQSGDTLLTASGTVHFDDSQSGNLGLSSSVTGLDVAGGAVLEDGFSVTLIRAGAIQGTLANITDNGGIISKQSGFSFLYDWLLEQKNGTDLIATRIGDAYANPQTKALSEGFLGGLALAASGADLAAGQGMAQAARAAADSGLNAFAAFSGGTLRHDTGSHVDMNSFSLMAGLAKGFAVAPCRLTLGAFFEYGNGIYDTFNAFDNVASVRGDGHAYSLGGGVLARMDFAGIGSGAGNFYAEAAARLGDLRNKYLSGDLRDSMGNSVGGYDTSSLYYGAHVKGGYLWNISEKASLDLSAAYLWTRVRGDDVTLATGDPVAFRNADSRRANVGARFAYAATECLSPYVGAAYEYEFAGEVRASTYGYEIDAP